ncbi:flavin reductase family protein [Streptomyces ipomoeae]|uniref:flavin reductase family protein n=1 Tax=Streptomyces ipomoeae TaxID=103232 RepID=UPI001147371D|nr:flavin reductase family protein [Streptomyces ipomoeae]MDX2937663.1 flavin reductase family protein [Streptomyces ipomoeae]TQE22780.1 flavin reductase [Streptomyces ipomoeae]
MLSLVWATDQARDRSLPEPSQLDGATLRQVFAHVPSAVVAICANDGVELLGMAASTFVPVSLDPPLVAFCVRNASETWVRLAELSHLGVSVLSADHGDAARVLGTKHGDRFAGIDVDTRPDGAVFVRGCPVRMKVSVEQQLPAGDHAIVVLRIEELYCADGVEPIVFHRSGFRRLISA